MNLQKLLMDFALSTHSRESILHGSTIAPAEFEQIARIALAGHFLVKGLQRDIVVRPTCLEFYYHEESDGGIKDPIVYHRNSMNAQYAAFPLGVLHNHVSGVDITFEAGTSPENAIRASMLIREFDVDGLNDDRSTRLYSSLYQQRSVFDGISVKWVDGDEPVDVVSYPRKNVALYDENGEKMTAKDYPDMPATEDKKLVQDMRKWQFRRSIVSDADTGKVFLSSWLKDECPDFYVRFTNLLGQLDIPFCIMKKTADIWARDYMPIQIYPNLFVQYRYNPDYLNNGKDECYITDTDAVRKEVSIETVKTNLIIDGGNVVKVGRYVIMTEKIYSENKALKPTEIRDHLKSLFHAEVIMLPWDRNEKYGHADGIVKGIDDHTVLMTNYEDYDPKMAKRFKDILSRYFTVHTLEYDEHNSDSNWAYINFLRVGNKIIIPGLGIAEDEQALKQISDYYPECEVYQIECLEVVKKGGSLNCITWNVKPENS